MYDKGFFAGTTPPGCPGLPARRQPVLLRLSPPAHHAHHAHHAHPPPRPADSETISLLGASRHPPPAAPTPARQHPAPPPCVAGRCRRRRARYGGPDPQGGENLHCGALQASPGASRPADPSTCSAMRHPVRTQGAAGVCLAAPSPPHRTASHRARRHAPRGRGCRP